MLISHEVPLELLETSLTFNDFDYLLPHYYVKYPKYKEFFIKAREKGRNIYMDNGLFEGGVFPENELLDIINEVKPNQFIVPDAWNNSYITLNNAQHWINIKNKLPKETELMIVLQGKSYSELSELVWSSIKLGYKSFGFNHSSIAYADIFPNKDPLISRTMGRVVTINRLMEEDVFDKLKKCKIHLLGCNLFIEPLYHNKQYITSIDTSNPIIMGLKGKEYDGNLILKPYKPEEKIEIFMEREILKNELDIIFKNISKFRQICY